MAAGKTCTRCKWWKPIEMFGLDAKRPDNRNPVCKPCCRSVNALSRARVIPISERSRQIRERIIRESRLPVLRQALANLKSRLEART